MTLRNADRVRDTSTTTGTGNFTVSGSAPSTFITFGSIPSIATSDTFYYTIVHQSSNEYETGLGTWQGSNVFARTTVYQSSNSNSLVNFSAGTKDVFCSLPASRSGAGGLYSPVLSATPTQSSTGLSSWINQGSSSVANNAMGMTLAVPSGGTGYSILYKARSSLTTFTALLIPTSVGGTVSVSTAMFFGFSDGTKLEGMNLYSIGANATYLGITRNTNYSTFSTNATLWQGYINFGPIWMRLNISAGTVKYYTSYDGVNFSLIWSNSETTFLANANNIFIGASTPPSDTAYVTIASWAES